MADPEKAEGKDAAPAKTGDAKKPQEQMGDWWDGFARAVEDPEISTYDYVKDSLLESLELDGADGVGDFLNKAQKKAIKELVELTDLRELRGTLKSLEKNKLFFDSRTRTSLQCAGVLLDAYLAAKDQYDAEVAKRAAQGQTPHTEEERKQEIERIVGEKLAEPKVKESLGEVAHHLTGRDKEEIKETVEHASRDFREKSTLSKMTGDVIGISKKYFTLDNAINVGIIALPLITWEFKWALAVVMGAYVSRMAAVHGYNSVKERLRGNKDAAKEEGVQALAALKAAGGNILAIGISPVVGKLPAAAAGFASFAVSYCYNTALEVSQKLLGKKVPEEEAEAEPKKGNRLMRWGKKFVTENQDTLASLAVGAVKDQMPSSTGKKVETASQRVRFSKLTTVAAGLWTVGGALSRRFNYEAHRLFGYEEPKIKTQIYPVKQVFTGAAAPAVEEGEKKAMPQPEKPPAAGPS